MAATERAAAGAARRGIRMTWNTIRAETRGKAGLVTLDRPKALNALNSELVAEVGRALDGFEADDGIGAIVIAGGERAFAAGADIKEMQPKSYMDAFFGDFIGPWDRVARCRKPTIAAVGGYALGGGCELAMMCDILIAAETARFGQPEIKLGTFPGSGGTQRLPRAIGKAKAMDLILTGRTMDAAEAERAGLISRIVAADTLLETALEVAGVIAGMSLPAVMMAKEAVNRSQETPLAEGILFERRLFYSTFALEDQKEGMSAFAEKRAPAFRNR